MSGDGNTVAVGTPMESSAATGINGKGENEPGDSSGAVYVYSRSGARWAYCTCTICGRWSFSDGEAGGGEKLFGDRCRAG